MALTQHKSKSEDALPSLQGRAMENLEFIRDAMQRSTTFTVVPGYGGTLMGATAVGASAIAYFQPRDRYWLFIWLTEAALAFAIGFLAMWQKSRSAETSLTSMPAKKFAFGFAPPVIAGVIITILLSANGLFGYLPCVWLTLYGTAVVTGGAYSVRPVPVLGWCFLALGTVAVFVPAAYGDVLMGTGFGILHIVFGLIIGKKYGG